MSKEHLSIQILSPVVVGLPLEKYLSGTEKHIWTV